MNTFLPYVSIAKSVRCLDNKRLGKQRVEAMQLLRGQWPNHPCSIMYRQYKDFLTLYHNACIGEWKRRGFKNTMRLLPFPILFDEPWWLGNEAFHSTMRANLLRKDPAWYGQFGWAETPIEGYIWPGEKEGEWRDMRKEIV